MFLHVCACPLLRHDKATAILNLYYVTLSKQVGRRIEQSLISQAAGI